MFGTLGFQELIIILVIVLIIFGAGRLPQIGEGVGKALKGFKKEVHESPVVDDSQGQVAPSPSPADAADPAAAPAASVDAATTTATTPPSPSQPPSATPQPYQPGPERTPGTLAAQVYGGFGPETVQPAQPTTATESESPYQEQFQPVTMEQRAAASIPRAMTQQYPPVPASAISSAPGKRPAAIVNKKAVARVQARRAEMQRQAAAAQPRPPAATDDLQSLGEGLGGALRTFREATADVRNTIDPEIRTIRTELESAQKDVEQSVEAAGQSLEDTTPPADSARPFPDNEGPGRP